MIFDSNGLPRDNGATDYMDSARLAGLMAITNHPNTPNLNLYVINGAAVRYPNMDAANPASNNPRNVTRDQIVCLTAGLYKQEQHVQMWSLQHNCEYRGFLGFGRAQNTEADIRGSIKPWYNGADLMLPSDMGHLRACSGLAPSKFQRLWLRCEILFHNYFTPMREPNQLICKAVVAGPAYVALLKRNKQFERSIRHYWADDGTTTPRNEHDFAEHIISFINSAPYT